VLDPKPPKARIGRRSGGDELRGFVLRRVVDDDAFPVRESLRPDRIERLRQQAGPVERRDDHGHDRHGSRISPLPRRKY
jgi:hypothetical protein